jgi:hypothetical protein
VNAGAGASINAPGVRVGQGGTAPGVGVGGTPPGLGGNVPGAGAGANVPGAGTATGGAVVPPVNPGAAAVQQNAAALRNAASQTPAAIKAQQKRAATGAAANGAANTNANTGVNPNANTTPASPNANTQTRQLATPRRNVVPGQERSAAVQNRNALRQGMTGTISSINGNSLTFNSGSGTQNLTITPDTQVQLNGENSTLAELPPNASVRVVTDPGNPTQIQKIIATTGTSGSTQAGTTAGTTTSQGTFDPNSRGFEGQGNDVAGVVNPDGSVTPTLGNTGTDATTTNTNGSTTRSNGRDTQADPRRPADQFFSNGSNQAGTTASQNRPSSQRTSNFRGEMNHPNGNRSSNGSAGSSQRPSGAAANGQQLQGQTPGTTAAASGTTDANGQATTTPNLGWTLQSTNRGALVSNVASGGVAARGSLQQGDVITGINGQSVSSPQEVNSILNQLAPNSTLQLQILRNGQTITQSVTMPKSQSSTQSTAPKTAEQIAEENRALESQIEAARNRDER